MLLLTETIFGGGGELRNCGLWGVGLFLFSQTTVPCQETASMLLSCDTDKRLVIRAKSYGVYSGCLA
jgi:hypothetical protein